MKKITHISITILILMISMAQMAQATVTTLYPTEDTYISSLSPDNFVAKSELYVYKSLNSGNIESESIALFRFDLSNIPKGSTINSAKLGLNTWLVHSPTPHIAAYKYSNNDWDPITVTWNNFPSGTYQYLSELIVPYSDQFYYWDVSPAINNGILTLVMRSTRTLDGSESLYFNALNGYNQSLRPILVIDHSISDSKPVASPEPTIVKNSIPTSTADSDTVNPVPIDTTNPEPTIVDNPVPTSTVNPIPIDITYVCGNTVESYVNDINIEGTDYIPFKSTFDEIFNNAKKCDIDSIKN